MKNFSSFIFSLLLTLLFYPQYLSAESKNEYEKILRWGDLHVHSNFSFDAYSFGNTSLGPDKAYEFAKG